MVITGMELIIGFIIHLCIIFMDNKNSSALILTYLSYKWADKVIKTLN